LKEILKWAKEWGPTIGIWLVIFGTIGTAIYGTFRWLKPRLKKFILSFKYPKEYGLYSTFEYANINWEVIEGIWKEYKDKLVGYNTRKALILNKLIGMSNFKVEILFSVDSIVDEINIQILSNELRIWKDGLGFVHPEERIDNPFEDYIIAKNHKHNLLIDKSGNKFLVRLDNLPELEFEIEEPQAYQKGHFGIRTWNGELTIYDLKIIQM